MAKKPTTPGIIKARVLSATVISGVRYESNDLVQIDADAAAAWVESGDLDDTPEGVAYVESLGGKARDHAAEVAALQAPAAE